MFGLGVPELLIIALLILLFFGAKRLPGIGTGLGKTVKEIRDIKKDMSPDKEPGKETESAEDPGSKKKSLEGKLARTRLKRSKSSSVEKNTYSHKSYCGRQEMQEAVSCRAAPAGRVRGDM
jgi:sec-independent protein translocase protein TatA